MSFLQSNSSPQNRSGVSPSPSSSPDIIPPQKNESPSPKKGGGFFKELLQIALIAAFVVLPIRIFIAQPFIVSGSSMDPTFENGDYLIVDQLSYRIEEPSRFQVVIFRFPEDPSKFFIKRIIGLPGERVEIQNGETYIFNDENPGGFHLNEPYVQNQSSENLDVTLGADEYFVMGDNRGASSDSRIWGPLGERFIVGKAFLRLLPVDEASFYPGTYSGSLLTN